MKILVLGVTGMLGSTVFNQLSKANQHDVWGTIRSKECLQFFSKDKHNQLLSNVDVLDQINLIDVLNTVRPDVVINCIGLIKQFSDANNPLMALPINSLLPHRLAKLCLLSNARLIHISTDCIFNGRRGMYSEDDISDAEDLYGKSKYIGELHDLPHAITLRTSIIGHELNSRTSLVDWFLSQKGEVKGYSKAVFSGLTTLELSKVIADLVIPNPTLRGLYHVSVDPIDKFTLLHTIANVYGLQVKVIADESLCIDRSLDSTNFQVDTGYKPPSWPSLIKNMYEERMRK
ncbi:MAG: SDR family oxidoreductase [Oceanospirillaceae bacterium]